MPGLSGVGPAMAAARIFTLNAEVEPKGVYAGTINIGAFIDRSAAPRPQLASSRTRGTPSSIPIKLPRSSGRLSPSVTGSR